MRVLLSCLLVAIFGLPAIASPLVQKAPSGSIEIEGYHPDKNLFLERDSKFMVLVKGVDAERLRVIYRPTSKVEGLEEGSEVWLKFKIAGGDKESCRKSQKMIFKNEVSVLQRYYSKGTTLNGNRCRNSDPPTRFYIGRSTGNCKYSDYEIY